MKSNTALHDRCHAGRGSALSEFRVIVGDCRGAMSEMPDDSFDAVITDIPYNEVNRASNGLRSLDKGEADSARISTRLLAREFARVSKGWVYVFCGFQQVSTLILALKRSGMIGVRLGFWHKSDPTVANGEHAWLSAIEPCVIAKHSAAPFYRHCVAPVWRGATDRSIDWHPTPKPEWLMRELVTASVPVGGNVLDPFMGSGSVGVACMAEDRNFTGIELNGEWADRARVRIGSVNLDLFHGAA
jgi:site-specific DNA-methyltransferase (adenine-specific)